SRALMSNPRSSPSSSSAHLSQSTLTLVFSSCLSFNNRTQNSSSSFACTPFITHARLGTEQENQQLEGTGTFLMLIWILRGSTFHTLPSGSTSLKNSNST